MAYTTVNKSTDYFNTKLYTGTGSTNAQTGIGFQPDWVWIQNRGGTYANISVDSVRGATKLLEPQGTGQEATVANSLTSFDSDGFTLGADSSNYCNKSSNNYVAWNWRAGGAASANSSGTISSSVSVNTTAGFSVVSYTGTGSAGATVGHGLGVAPAMIIEKARTVTDDWLIYHQSIGNTHGLALNNTTAQTDSDTYFNDTSPTSTVFSLGNNGKVNTNGGTHIAYCFAEKKGFSRFGQYLGNGNTDGTFVYTGFRPAFVLVKKYSATESWQITDHPRDVNVAPNYARVLANDGSSAEATNTTWAKIQKASNGFKLCHTDGVINASGSTYIYMAFADAPLVGSNDEPCKAR
tara:strand:+ start:1611 stop:2663 length:1053 start_codon:yes stop_codon:yes gene_type:complete